MTLSACLSSHFNMMRRPMLCAPPRHCTRGPTDPQQGNVLAMNPVTVTLQPCMSNPQTSYESYDMHTTEQQCAAADV